MTEADDKRWLTYLAAIGDEAPPRDTLVAALRRWSGPPGHAVDLGAGQGRDTVHLLRQGWRVTAVDKTAEAIRQIHQACPGDLRHRLTLLETPFETMVLPPDIDLVNASFSLPFCAPDRFEAVWQQIVTALGDGGIFCGHFLGPDDDWAGPGVVTESADALEQRFASWRDVDIQTTHGPATTAKGRTKVWHLHRVVAVK